MSRAAADIAIFCVCAGAFLFYHIALLVFRFDPASVYHHSSLVNVHSQARSSRRFWVEKIAEREAEAIIGIQTLRNAIMAVTFLAAIVTVTLSSSLDLVFDEQKLAFIQDIASDDPITGDDTVSPRTKIAVALACQLVSLLLLTQSCRLYAHATFYSRSSSSMRAEDADAFSREVAQFNSVLQRGQLCFMLGLRVFYFFLCLAFWVLGPVSLLVGTAFVLATLGAMDFVVPAAVDGVPKSGDNKAAVVE